MDDLSVLNRDDRDEPIAIGCAARKNPAVHVVLKDHDATILRAVHNKCVAGVKLDRLAVSGEASHQIGASSNRRRPAGKAIARFEECVFGKRVEIVFAIRHSKFIGLREDKDHFERRNAISLVDMGKRQ
jgi:hypothetical protein